MCQSLHTAFDNLIACYTQTENGVQIPYLRVIFGNQIPQDIHDTLYKLIAKIVGLWKNCNRKLTRMSNTEMQKANKLKVSPMLIKNKNANLMKIC